MNLKRTERKQKINHLNSKIVLINNFNKIRKIKIKKN